MSDSHRSRGPGPRRPAGSPAGPDEVSRAVLDAAAALFAVHGVDAVSLRDIAAAADVNLSLIRRYIGRRDELVAAVFGHVSDQLAQAVEEHPLSGQGFSPDTVMGKWVRIAAALVISARLPAHPLRRAAVVGRDSDLSRWRVAGSRGACGSLQA